jgi:hypothetical protein
MRGNFNDWKLGHYWFLDFGVSLPLPFFKRVEDSLDFFSPPELGGEELDLPFAVHLPSQGSVFKKVLSFHFELKDEAQFVNSAFGFDRIEENGMKDWNVFFPRLDSGSNGNLPQGIHDPGNVDIIGASHTAGIAGGADPDRLRTQDPLPVVVLDVTEHLIGKDVHGISDRAACRTFLTLIAGLRCFTAYPDDF